MHKLKQLLLALAVLVAPSAAFAQNTHNLQEVLTQGLKRVKIAGSFAPNGSSGLTAGATNGVGYTVARTGVGTYTITLSEPYSALIDAQATVQESAHGATMAEFGAYSATSKTLVLYTWQRQLGTIDLPIAGARILATNDIQNTAATGGLPTKNTAPILQAAAAGSDQSLQLVWAASGAQKVAWQVSVPADSDTTVAMSANAFAKMGGGTDTPTLTFEAFPGIGGANQGGTTGALGPTNLAQVSVALGTTGIAYPGNLGLTLVPGAHTSDTVILTNAWLTYTRKDLVDLAANANNRIHFEIMFKNSSLGGTGAGAQ